MAIEKIPTTVEEVTPQWLTQALRSTRVIKSARVTAADRAGDVAIEGHTGPLARLKLSYDFHEQGAPRSLIAKLPASDPKVRIYLSGTGLYERDPVLPGNRGRGANWDAKALLQRNEAFSARIHPPDGRSRGG